MCPCELHTLFTCVFLQIILDHVHAHTYMNTHTHTHTHTHTDRLKLKECKIKPRVRIPTISVSNDGRTFIAPDRVIFFKSIKGDIHTIIYMYVHRTMYLYIATCFPMDRPSSNMLMCIAGSRQIRVYIFFCHCLATNRD